MLIIDTYDDDGDWDSSSAGGHDLFGLGNTPDSSIDDINGFDRQRYLDIQTADLILGKYYKLRLRQKMILALLSSLAQSFLIPHPPLQSPPGSAPQLLIQRQPLLAGHYRRSLKRLFKMSRYV
jgi:hypothetical protein